MTKQFNVATLAHLDLDVLVIVRRTEITRRSIGVEIISKRIRIRLDINGRDCGGGAIASYFSILQLRVVLLGSRGIRITILEGHHPLFETELVELEGILIIMNTENKVVEFEGTGMECQIPKKERTSTLSILHVQMRGINRNTMLWLNCTETYPLLNTTVQRSFWHGTDGIFWSTKISFARLRRILLCHIGLGK